MVKNRYAIVLAAAAMLLLVGCSTGGDAASDTPDAEFVTAAEAAAASSLLLPPDYPEGWGEDLAGNAGEPLDLDGECVILDSDELPGQVAGKTSNDFAGPGGQNVNTSTAIFASERRAQEMFQHYVNAVSNCATDYLEALKNDVYATPAPVESVTPEASGTPAPTPEIKSSLENHPSGGYGDVSVGYRVRLENTDPAAPTTVVADIVIIRRGRMLGSLVFAVANAQPNPTEESFLLAAFSNKLAAGDASVPGATTATPAATPELAVATDTPAPAPPQ